VKYGVVIGLILPLLLSFTACDDSGTTPPPLPGNTPAEVLELIEDYFSGRDVIDLERLLTADFVFYFDDSDVGTLVGDYIIPESWTLTDFLSAVSRVFDNAYSIDISITSANVGEPGSDDTTYTAENIQIQFLVFVDTVNGYLAQGFVTFEFEAVYNEKNEKEWRVAAWRDFTSPTESGGRSVTEASFGEILAIFHRP
jgi:hypothetical protein